MITDISFTGKKQAYLVKYESGDVTTTIVKRYSEFHALHKQLKEVHDKDNLPKLPSKRMFRDNTDKLFLQRRCLGLETYLNGLDSIGLANTSAVQDFINGKEAESQDRRSKSKSRSSKADSHSSFSPRGSETSSSSNSAHSSRSSCDNAESSESQCWYEGSVQENHESEGRVFKQGQKVAVWDRPKDGWVYICNQYAEGTYVPESVLHLTDILIPAEFFLISNESCQTLEEPDDSESAGDDEDDEEHHTHDPEAEHDIDRDPDDEDDS